MKPVAKGPMQPFTATDVATIRAKLTAKAGIRDLALFEVAVSSMLRGSDLVALTVFDVTDKTGAVVPSFWVHQTKTGKRVQVELSAKARAAVAALIADESLSGMAPLFARDDNAAGATRTAMQPRTFRNLVKGWADLAGYVDARRFSGHSTRRTRASIIYRETNNLEVVRQMLGHTSLSHTATYLAVSNAEVSAVSARFEI